MLVKKMDAEGKYFTTENPEMSVSFILSGYISVIALPLHQLFKIPPGLTSRQLPGRYPTVKSMFPDAACYTEGVINKGKFLKELSNTAFLKKHNLTPTDVINLREFITNLNCSCLAAKERLYIRGYGRIAEEIDFYEPTPELIQSCQLFSEFIKAAAEKNLL